MATAERSGDPTVAWAASGAMWLTGHADGPPLSPGAAVVPALEAAARSLVAGTGVDIDVADLLTGRAALRGLRRQGRRSANGSCRLIPVADGWATVNLARASDVEAVGALTERTVDGDPWAALVQWAAAVTGADLVERATLLGVPAAAVPECHPAAPPPAFTLHRLGEPRPAPPTGPLLVIDLSAMWAGPLCARLLGLTGHRIVKVESTARPDGARAGHAGFYDWLHRGHESVALDLTAQSGRATLGRLLARADIVIESSRPRALRQLGIEAESVIAAGAGTTWVSITGYGRAGAAGDRVAFGDDAAAAAGLVARDHEGQPVFCGDAIADPITGLFAALATRASIAAGGGHLVEVPMVAAVAATLTEPAPAVAAEGTANGDWVVPSPTGPQPVRPPRPPAPGAPARPLGADTAAVLHELGEPVATRPC